MSVRHTHSRAKGVRGKFKYEVEAHSKSSKVCKGDVTSVRHTHSRAKGVRGKLRV